MVCTEGLTRLLYLKMQVRRGRPRPSVQTKIMANATYIK
jgi:hypothetical protein